MSGYQARQGDIIRLNFDPHFDPQSGHEQAGRRPAVVVSNATANQFLRKRAMVCPITRTDKGIPIQPRLDSRTETAGVVLCDQARILDLEARDAEYVEQLPPDILHEVIDIIYGLIEPLPAAPPTASVGTA
ncbi:MAG: type II toxin-antitoxin system PemK/MazF family toxin [Bifidobacteriaceae bacterium]|nr:type II toxin-antitoxin system PemK/MazF family toxin [Bifidobacteriaceae bacterium]